MEFKLIMLPPHRQVVREWAARLAGVPGLKVVVASDAQEAQREIVDADGAYGMLPLDLLQHAAKLRWLQSPAAAPAAGYYYPELVAHPVIVTNMREMVSDHIGAHIMSFVYAFARGLHYLIPQQLRGEWKPPANEALGVVHLPEATALIVGVGGIGAETARLAAAAGMTVIGIDPRRREPPAGMAAIHTPDKLDMTLACADFVILTVPHTPETEGFFNRARFQRMRKTAFFINIGRGMTTRLDDLVDSLRAAEIAGAALDVFEIEPLPAEHPLWTMPGVILTPHMAGNGPYLEDRRFEILAHNCRAMIAGDPLRNVVDKAAWF